MAAKDTKKNVSKSRAEEEPSKRTWYNQYKKIWDDVAIERLAFEMVEFFEREQNAVHYAHFCAAYPIDRQRLKEFRDKNEVFKTAYEHCRNILIGRWESLGITMKNPAFAIFNLFNLAPDDFKNKQEVEHSGGIQINISKFEDMLKDAKPEIE